MKVARIKKYGETWDFLSEADLEDFVWANLKELLDINPLLRQYPIDHQNRCDILALDHHGRLHILELKKGVDDGIISQLTRYYASIKKNPLKISEINESHEISLSAISNGFHKNSFLDAHYSHLNFRFLRYSIQDKNNNLLFQLYDQSNDIKIAECSIEAVKDERQELLPSPSKLFSRLLQTCDNLEHDAMLETREKVLLFDRKIQELNKQGRIVWIQGKSYSIAEFRLDNTIGKAFLYLYLPFRKAKGRQTISVVKAKIWLSGNKVTDVGFVFHPRMNPVTHAEWLQGKSFCREQEALKYWKKHLFVNEEDLRKKNIRSFLLENHSWFGAEYGLALPIRKYEELLKVYGILHGSRSCPSLSDLTDIALLELAKKRKR